MKYNQIRKLDISNGSGCGVSIFTQGCNIYCKGCFNKDLWDITKGKEWTNKEFETICQYLNNPYINHLTWLGGEPTIWASAIADINRQIKNKFPDKKIWLYSGHTLQELLNKEVTRDLLYTIDYLVDGPFINNRKDINLKFRGSSNQHIYKRYNDLYFIESYES